jgi:hypothetical protein
MRKFAPAFLEAFEFNATDAGDDLKDAITLPRDQNSTGKRKLPDDPPMPFAAKHWPALIIQDGKPQRRVGWGAAAPDCPTSQAGRAILRGRFARHFR